MSNLVFCSKENIPLTSTDLIAEALNYKHENAIKLTRKYLSDLEQFGRVRFEIQPFETNGGNQPREIAILNEPQATLLVCFMQNNPKVRKFKVELVKAFYEMKQKLSQQNAIYTQAQLDERLKAQKEQLEGDYEFDEGKVWNEGYEYHEQFVTKTDSEKLKSAYNTLHWLNDLRGDVWRQQKVLEAIQLLKTYFDMLWNENGASSIEGERELENILMDMEYKKRLKKWHNTTH